MSTDDDAARLVRERDLYRHCLELSTSDEPVEASGRVLEGLADLVGARVAHIELTDVASAAAHTWSLDAGERSGPRTTLRWISRGVVAVAIDTAQTVRTDSAARDARFADRQSVSDNQIAAVLCAPVCADGVVGAVYLQDQRDGGTFGVDDQRCAELVARHVGALAARLLSLSRPDDSRDLTRQARQRVAAPHVIGHSKALAETLERVGVVAAMESNVLLTGASGTGKTMFARILHTHSRRAAGPFVEVNCTSIPRELAENELFGAERGAHSGVVHGPKIGLVEAAQGGTLFLDELGELDRPVQAKLLQLLQSKQYLRLGATTPMRADIRIVAATNRDLEAESDNGAFRQDLYYRIRGVEIRIPSLAERGQDVALLASHLTHCVAEEESLPRMTLSPAALAALQAEAWPGNVRQLRNACRDAAVNAQIDGVTTIQARHVFPGRGEASEPEASETFHAAKQRLERAFLHTALSRRDWNIALTARELEMSRSHLNVLVGRYGLRRE